MYAQVLEKNGFAVVRKLDLGGTQVAMEALQRGDIDLYPEYTGTALVTELKGTPGKDARANYDDRQTRIRAPVSISFGSTPAPFNDTQALATTQAHRGEIRICARLSDLAKAAPQLRLGAIPEFIKRAGRAAGLAQSVRRVRIQRRASSSISG